MWILFQKLFLFVSNNRFDFLPKKRKEKKKVTLHKIDLILFKISIFLQTTYMIFLDKITFFNFTQK